MVRIRFPPAGSLSHRCLPTPPPHQTGVATVTAGQREIAEHPWHALIEHRAVVAAERFVATGGSTPLRYLFCVKPKYAREPATRTPSQLTQNGMPKPPISTCHPKMIRSRCITATMRNSVAVTVI